MSVWQWLWTEGAHWLGKFVLGFSMMAAAVTAIVLLEVVVERRLRRREDAIDQVERDRIDEELRILLSRHHRHPYA